MSTNGFHAFAYEWQDVIATCDEIGEAHGLGFVVEVDLLVTTMEGELPIEIELGQVEENRLERGTNETVHRLLGLLATCAHETLVETIGHLMVSVVRLLEVYGLLEVGIERIREGVLKPEFAKIDHHALSS